MCNCYLKMCNYAFAEYNFEKTNCADINFFIPEK